MKRVSLCLTLILTLSLLVACGSSDAGSFSADDLYLNIGGRNYHLQDDIATVIAHLGEDYNYAEGLSCDYDGLDKTFIYEGLAEFYTFPIGGDLLSEIYTENPEASTSKGIKVGASKADVIAAYGEDCEETAYELRYVLSDSRGVDGGALCFDLENDRVKAFYVTITSV